MFKFLKDKLKKAVSKFSKDVDEETEEEVLEKEEGIEEEKITEEVPEEVPEEPSSEEKEEDKKKEISVKTEDEKEEVKEEPEEQPQEETQEQEKPKEEQKETTPEKTEKETTTKQETKEETTKEPEQETQDKKGFLSGLKKTVTDKVVKKSLSEEKFEELFWDLEVVLLENNVAVEVIDKIKQDLKEKLVNTKVIRGKISEVITSTLRDSISGLFVSQTEDLLDIVERKKPFVILFLGVNGSGKTTNLAKVAHYLQKHGKSVVVAAADTFRAAAIQQIEEHTKKLGVKLIKHEYGADAAAVAFDAVKHAEAKGKDVVLIDTAGRSHSNVNLMDELKKVVRVAKPDLKIFVGDSLTGNDAVQQAMAFNDAVGIDGIILTKLDVDEKGGAAISVSYVTKKPILFVGTGQSYDDLRPFSKKQIIENLGIEA
ncbi:signal recognition particle-docking protein FtsY [Candidatus Woesearchaeota archaeon]|nr:MAG: signal recognition particle-docking protein FtsY [Candidatus Woesearchaeota archaeon]